MFFVHRLADGALVSFGTVVASPEELAARGLAAVEVPDGQVPTAWDWDATTLLPVARPPEAEPLLLYPDELIDRFTPEEWGAARASTHPAMVSLVDQILAAAGRQIDARSARVSAGLAAAEALGFLEHGRAAEIQA